jgi:hypothetical protein
LVATVAKSAPNPNRIVNLIVRLTRSAPVPDNGHLPAARALPGQPFAIEIAGLASIRGTWDKNDHGCEGIRPESLPRKGH